MERVPAASNTPSFCPCCGGDCVPQNITLPLRRASQHYIILKNVPAEVCESCGETQFSMRTTMRLVATMHPDRAPDDFAVTPIYDFAVTAS